MVPQIFPNIVPLCLRIKVNTVNSKSENNIRNVNNANSTNIKSENNIESVNNANSANNVNILNCESGSYDDETERNMKNLTCSEFCDELASSAPVPGGGGASALVGALAACLGEMVGMLTVGKKKYADSEADMLYCIERSESLRKRLLELIQQDADGFSPLAAAYRLPKGTEEEKAEKERVVQSALAEACAVPEEIMDCCLQALDLTAVYEEKGSVMALSDAAASALLCKAALTAASLNIRINAKSMTDRKKAEELMLRIESKIAEGEAKANSIYQDALEKMI